MAKKKILTAEISSDHSVWSLVSNVQVFILRFSMKTFQFSSIQTLLGMTLYNDECHYQWKNMYHWLLHQVFRVTNRFYMCTTKYSDCVELYFSFDIQLKCRIWCFIVKTWEIWGFMVFFFNIIYVVTWWWLQHSLCTVNQEILRYILW